MTYPAFHWPHGPLFEPARRETVRSYGLTNSAVLRWALEVVGPRACSLCTSDGYVSALELLKSFVNERRSNLAIVCRYVALFVGVYIEMRTAHVSSPTAHCCQSSASMYTKTFRSSFNGNPSASAPFHNIFIESFLSDDLRPINLS